MKITDVMARDPLTVTVDTDLGEAMTHMDAHDIRHLPVVGQDGAILGVVSDRDVLEATGWLPHRVHEAVEPTARRKTVADIMHAPAITVPDRGTLADAASEMVSRGLGCVLVVRNDRLVGIVSESDLLNAFHRSCQLSPRTALDPPVTSKMSENAVHVPAATPIQRALELCAADGFRHLPVVDQDRVVGIVSDRDLRRAIGSHRSEDTPVEEVMSRSVFSAAPGQHLSDAAEIMLHYKISALPVVDDELLVGIVTTTDLLDHFLTALTASARPRAT